MPASNAAKLDRVEASNIEQVDFAVCPVIQKANITGRVKVVRASIEPQVLRIRTTSRRSRQGIARSG